MLKERIKCIFSEALNSFITGSVPVLVLFWFLSFLVPGLAPTPMIVFVFSLMDLSQGIGVCKERFKSRG